KVTNPKQAIAIALSEANAMNQGGMMYNEIMNRPMFQTPQMREGGGIMAGVAPIRGYAEGDLVSDDFFTLEKTEEGSGMNLRDVTDFFFDPEDPIDYATIGLMAFPPAYVAARLARMGIKGQKAAEQVQKVVRAQEALPSKLGGGPSRTATGLQVQVGAGVPMAVMGEDEAMAQEMPMPAPEAASGGIESLMPETEKPTIVGGRSRAAQRKAEGGIASVQGYAVGGKVVEKGIEFVRNLFARARKGEDVTDEVSDAVRKGDIDVEDGDAIIQAQMDLPGIPPAVAKKADDVADALDDVPTPPAPPSLGKRIGKGLGVLGLGVGGVYGASEYLRRRKDEEETAAASGGKAQQTAQQKAQQAAAQGPAPLGVPPAQAQVFIDPETGEYKQKATGIKKFLFGEDGIGGEQSGFAGNILSKLQDPRTQYALAKAAQPSEGFVPRNFFSDVALAGREYDIQQAELDRLEQAAKPEIVQQFEAIRQYAQPSEGETEADVDRRVFKSLFDDMTANAQLEALLTLYKAMPSAEEAGLTLQQFSDQLGLGNVSRLLTKIEDQS
ncbi:hypothetical protein, partial [Methylophaga sp.]|uniref:hypothetical protein n=1 Tax=Methylophaga sp. TaxID=2024840 RepID=UPI000C8972A3